MAGGAPALPSVRVQHHFFARGIFCRAAIGRGGDFWRNDGWQNDGLNGSGG